MHEVLGCTQGEHGAHMGARGELGCPGRVSMRGARTDGARAPRCTRGT